jgi:hypothetical protein
VEARKFHEFTPTRPDFFLACVSCDNVQ